MSFMENIEIVRVSVLTEVTIDISDKRNGKSKTWSKDENGNWLYESYIGTINDYMYTNTYSSNLFHSVTIKS